MPIYDRSTKELMYDFAEECLTEGQVFSKKDAVGWFQINYPKIKSNTVQMHVDGMSINSPYRKHHPEPPQKNGSTVMLRKTEDQR